MKTLRQQYSDLDSNILNDFSDLISKVKHIKFIEYDLNDEEDYDDLSDCENISIINSFSGNYLDLKVLEICEEKGIYVAMNEDESNRFWISFYDISNLYDKITITQILSNSLTDKD